MTLEELRNQIKDEAPYVGVKPYSHNIITMCLGTISQEHGIEEANKAIFDFKLGRKGWQQAECPHCGHIPCGCGG